LTGNNVVGNSFFPANLTPLQVLIAQNAAHYAVITPTSATPMENDYRLPDT
jgi:hypothetical protein